MSVLKLFRFIVSHPLNRHRKARALAGFAKWQVASRLAPGAIVFDWLHGARFVVRTGETGLTGNIYTGLHEFADMAFLLHVLRAEDLFVDVGANVGSYSILGGAVAGARGIAFEPVPGTYRRLVENMRINALDETVTCLNRGVGAQPGRLRFSSDADTTNHALAAGEQCENPVEVVIDTLDNSLRGRSPLLMKIDVEGYETPALEGGQAALADAALRAVIMELNGSGSRYGYDETRLLEMMFDHGFESYAYDPFARTLAALPEKNNSQGNTLFIRDRRFIEARLTSAPAISVHGVSL